jgi:hypothetical protein
MESRPDKNQLKCINHQEAAMGFRIVALIVSLWLAVPSVSGAQDFPVYPLPLKVQLMGGSLDLSRAEIVFLHGPSERQGELARYLSRELALRYRLPLTCRNAGGMPETSPRILLGLNSDPEIRQAFAGDGLSADNRWEVQDWYRVKVGPEGAVIAGGEDRKSVV